MKFKDIEIGKTFKVVEPKFYPYKEDRVMEYVKVSKTKARCIFQSSYGNDRAIDGVYTFQWSKEV